MNYSGPKVKLSRKIGINMTPKAGKVTQRKPNPPGQHGALKRRAKQSDYGRQLLEKQRLRLQYNLVEKQMLNYYKQASHLTGNTGDLLVQLLESRLDAIVYRSGLARTIYAARQYVKHGHIYVNGKKVDIPSFHLIPNDIVSVREKSKKLDCFQESIRNSAAPEYLSVSKADFTSKYLNVPSREDVPVQCEVPLVIEFYSR
ncbi:MAG: 30S ribosomal protein S4 [Candidatus Kapabacteria bacterium]|nr:30S ribosomal protein S4 [Candidatus Kapabacteria bacterium]